MIPGMNPRKMNQMMKRMGIAQQEIDATEVIIRTADQEIVFHNPQVAKVNMMGQTTYQVVGHEEVREATKELNAIEINEEDVKTVMEQAGVDEETAKKAIQEHDGNLAEAILRLNEKDQ